MVKFRRNYEIAIQTREDGYLYISPPFTIEFDINRNIFSSANQASFRIYNLSEVNRTRIRHDQFDWGDIRSVNFQAGYEDKLSTAFSGNITQASSVREKNNFITQITCADGGFAFANSNYSDQFPPNTHENVILESLIKNLNSFGVAPGVIGDYSGITTRGASYNGSTTDLLRNLTGGGFFIDNGKVNCLRDNEYIFGDTLLINAESGLLGTPQLEQTNITFEMLFEPRIVIGQKIRLQSRTGAMFNGDYKVISLKHRGTISDAVCGDAITTVGLYYGPSTLKEVS